ncbi:hypothetical protein DKX38_000531 [Salix brachista]|uniref:Uncharacterized protein n=1 Tax=Salix brachista TaxID=2182728 RepID=A0A5N5P2A8_9ROSI|nr:hypothetical protein DKX38_000531 [Salix brachista]
MNSFPLAEPGTSQSSNITNADDEKRARKKENALYTAQKERRENEERLVEVTKQNYQLREVNARLVKEVVEAKVKQQNVEQELSYFKEEQSRVNNKLSEKVHHRLTVLRLAIFIKVESTDRMARGSSRKPLSISVSTALPVHSNHRSLSFCLTFSVNFSSFSKLQEGKEIFESGGRIDHVKTRHPIMSDSKFFDDAKDFERQDFVFVLTGKNRQFRDARNSCKVARGGTSQFVTTPNHAEVNPGSMTVQWAKQQGSFLDWHGDDLWNIVDQLPDFNPHAAETAQFETSPEYALSKHLQPPHQDFDPPVAGALQFGRPPSHAPLNPESMDVHPPPLAQQPGTSQPSNIANAADAAKREKIRESKRKSWTERKENEKRLAEVTKENGVLLEANARLEKEGGEAKVKQKSVEQELSYCKEEVSRLNNKLRGQTMQVDVLSEKLVASHEATDVAEENKQLKRKIELLTTNNPDIIKTVELQEENEKLKRELKKLRILNDALCVKLTILDFKGVTGRDCFRNVGFVQPVQHSVSMDPGEDDKKMFCFSKVQEGKEIFESGGRIDHIKTRLLIMSDSKFFDDAKGNCSDENIGDRSDAQNQELVNDQISDPNQLVDAANSSPSGTPAGGTVPFPSMNNQLQMSVEPESGVIILQNANTFLAEENLDLKFQCGRMKRAQKRQKTILDGEKEKGIVLADMAANLSKILLMGIDAQLQERITELEASNAQLRERNTELEASNAQLRERNTLLENGSNERAVDKENDHELGAMVDSICDYEKRDRIWEDEYLKGAQSVFRRHSFESKE